MIILISIVNSLINKFKFYIFIGYYYNINPFTNKIKSSENQNIKFHTILLNNLTFSPG